MYPFCRWVLVIVYPPPCVMINIRPFVASVITCISLCIVSSAGYSKNSFEKVKKSEDIQIVEQFDKASNRSPHALKFKGQGKIEFEARKQQRKNQDEVTFYQLKLKPSVARSEKPEPTVVRIGGAVLGYQFVSEAASAELLVAIGKTDRKDFEWYRTGVYLAHEEDGSVIGHMPIVVRSDDKRKLWDLYLYQELFLTDLPLFGNGKGFEFQTVGKGETSVRNVQVGDENPLFTDNDFDGIPDTFNADFPGLERDDLLEETGTSLLVEYLARKPEAFDGSGRTKTVESTLNLRDSE